MAGPVRGGGVKGRSIKEKRQCKPNKNVFFFIIQNKKKRTFRDTRICFQIYLQRFLH